MATAISTRITLSGQPPRKLICGTAAIREEWTGRIVLAIGCSSGDCIRDVNICFPQHADGRFVYDVVDQNGDPVDVVDSRVRYIIAESVRGTILIEKDSDQNDISFPSASKMQWDLSSAESGALPARSLYHELLITTTGGDQRFGFAGRFQVQDTRILDT